MLMPVGIRYMAEDQGEVTILFCYICQYDKILNKLGTHIVETLDNLFRVCDQICVNNGVQKIEVLSSSFHT
jgi:phospholipid-translocating ATPase